MALVLLRSLLAVADRRGVTSAARALFVTQPALSRRLQQLEEEMGTPLFIRGRTGVQLTDAGRVVAQEARAIVERYDRIRELIRAQESLETGVVRIGGGATAVSFLVPKAIAAFQKEHPGVRFEVIEQGSRDVLAEVRAERVDLGIVTLPVESLELNVRSLASDRIVLVAAAGHPLARRRRIDAKDLAGQGLVGFWVARSPPPPGRSLGSWDKAAIKAPRSRALPTPASVLFRPSTPTSGWAAVSLMRRAPQDGQ